MAAQYLKLLQKKMATKLDTDTYSQDDMKYCQKKCSKESRQFEQNKNYKIWNMQQWTKFLHCMLILHCAII